MVSLVTVLKTNGVVWRLVGNTDEKLLGFIKKSHKRH